MLYLTDFWRSTEVVITGPPRKRLSPQGDRGFESHLLRQESHFEKSRLEASAQSASTWYFSAILKAFLKSHASVRSAIRKFAERSSGKMKFYKPIFFLSLSAKG